MKPYLKRTLLMLTVLVLSVGFFSSCDLLGITDPIAVLGTWKIDSTGEEWVITETTIEYPSLWGGWKADIVDVSNDGLNGGDTAIADGGSTVGLGYAVIRYTEVAGPGTGEVGKYQIFRWATNTNDATLRDFTVGYKNVGDPWPDNVNEVFSTPASAKTGATIANGHFAFASAGAVKQ